MDQKLLIEVGTEELPAIPLLKELDNISKKWQIVLEKYALASEFEFFYTPRRLVLFHKSFKTQQENSFAEFIGAPKELAYKDGVLSAAAKSFMQKTGLKENELEFKEIKGKEVLYHKKEIQCVKSSKLLAQMIEEWLKSLNFGKTMRWGNGEYEFIRAIRSFVCILGDELIEFESYGVKSAKKSFVHRSVSYEALEFKTIDEYFKLLKDNFVILDQEQRKEKILAEFKELEVKHKLSIAEDIELLAEVVAITEYPKALLGSFEAEFLEIPSEVIITSMRENQRYFSVFDKNKLSNHFIVVANAVCKDYKQIIMGNERVLRARLSDAMFFWQNDIKTGLQPSKLSNIMYMQELGTMLDKVAREKKIASFLCQIYDLSSKEQEILKALDYAKCDLLTQMVYEFGELQGVMGYYYAKKMNLSEEIAEAIKEQYLPNAEKDPLPSSEFSSIVALSYKLDTLMGLFSIGKIPSGTKDPYALRRAANGILKIVFKLQKSLKLKNLLDSLSLNYKSFDTRILYDFMLERLYTFYPVNASFIKAVLSSQNDDLLHIDASIKALIELSNKENFNENFTTFKRLANIASANSAKIDEKLFEHKAESTLFEAFKKCDLNAKPKVVLESLFALKPYIDDFFDKVMINTQDSQIKNNRQALVYSIYKAFLNIADIKELSV
ncbi:glycine--tRNA ligase subunit beta [Campylobacter sp. MIT 19-121]|uniref:glycine--tRNA ligase subunit beta n=1 Tax=Campylobacter sp. MIT 19-121 TaxID=2703906 RepID=UPI001389C289|nr:glycine--tRNA ligase subunit beta [Campylobacter sp. MIT 19-121]NDJ27549.1 glycine--tRNA ligase subunit beta [Campylobacter sp. MIT 19-121]